MNGPEYSASCPAGALNTGTVGKANRQAAGHPLFLLLSDSSQRIFQISLSDYNTIGHLSFTEAITFTFTCSTGKVGHFSLRSPFVRFKCSFHFSSICNEYDFGMNQSNIPQHIFLTRTVTSLGLMYLNDFAVFYFRLRAIQ